MKELDSIVKETVGIAEEAVSRGAIGQARFDRSALAGIGNLTAETGECISFGVFEPREMPLYGGVLNTLLGGQFCTGDAVMRELLDGETPAAMADDMFRILSVGITPKGVDIVYGRPYLAGHSLKGGKMVKFHASLPFNELSDGDKRRLFTAELRDSNGDAKKVIFVDLREQAIGVTDVLEGVCVAVPRE